MSETPAEAREAWIAQLASEGKNTEPSVAWLLAVRRFGLGRANWMFPEA
jgi:hypothetical protein